MSLISNRHLADVGVRAPYARDAPLQLAILYQCRYTRLGDRGSPFFHALRTEPSRAWPASRSYFVISPHAMRSPALPDGSDFRSSAFA
jgi:hypothetical protein